MVLTTLQIQLRDLGVIISEDYNKSTHIVAGKVLRTKKFICALARGVIPLSESYIDKSLAQKTLLDPDEYILNDPESEQHYGIILNKVLERAKYNRGKLLVGQSIYVLEGVTGGFEQYKEIIEANGGKALLYRGRAGAINKSRADDDSEEDESNGLGSDFLYLVSSPNPSPADIRLWQKFRQGVEAVGKVPRVVRTDWMLDMALSQEVKWDEKYEMTE